MRMTFIYGLLCAHCLIATASAQLIEQPARVRKISYDNHSQVVPLSDVRVKVETEERSDAQGLVSIKISSNHDGTFSFRDIQKMGFTLISPTEEELRIRRFALNPHARQEIILASKIELQQEKKRIVSTRKEYLEKKIALLRDQVERASDSSVRQAQQQELDELLSNYDRILSYIDREAESLARVDCLTLSDRELKNINFKKEGKADELIAYNLSLLPEDEEEQARALIKAIKQGEIQLEKIAQLQAHWGEVYKHIAQGHQLRHQREEAAKWWHLRTLLAPESLEYRLDYAQFLESYTTHDQTALDEYKQCLKMTEGAKMDHDLHQRLHRQIGTLHARMGDFALAFESYSKAGSAQYAMKEGRDIAEAQLLTHIALAESMRDNYQRALSYLIKAQRVFEQQGDKSHQDAAHCSLALALNYARLGKQVEARCYLERVKPLLEQLHGLDHLAVADSLECEGLLAQLARQTQQAQQAFRAAIAIRERILGKQHPSTRRLYHLMRLSSP